MKHQYVSPAHLRMEQHGQCLTLGHGNRVAIYLKKNVASVNVIILCNEKEHGVSTEHKSSFQLFGDDCIN
jgi:hypothetical protein